MQASVVSRLDTHAAHIDFETGSAVELRTHGVHKQMEHPSTRVWGFRWCLIPKLTLPDPREVYEWQPGQPDPEVLLEWVAAGGTVVAHNAMFERTVWNTLLPRNYNLFHWPRMRIEQQDCTLARCSAIAIPNSLEIAGQVLGTKSKKDMVGHALMMKMARPRSRMVCTDCQGAGCQTCSWVGETYTWWDQPENIRGNLNYCGDDVLTECDIDTRAPLLSERERRLWIHDQTVNDRGIKLDVPLIHRAIALREYAKDQLNAEMRQITGGAVTKFAQTKKIVEWINAQGISCKSIAKDQQAAVLAEADDVLEDDLEFMLDESDLPNVVERAVAVRKLGNKTSTAKFTAMLNVACEDGRARGLFHYHGASTGRYAGRLIQPHNLYLIDPDRDGDSIRQAVDILLEYAKTEEAHFMLQVLVGPPMEMLAKTLRGMFIAERGKLLIGADLSNIEGRVAAWLAGEEWKLKAFRDYDALIGPDLYNVAYARSFGIETADVTKAQRQIGKVEELSLGYQGSVGAFINMGKNYGLQPAKLVAPVHAAVGEQVWNAMAARYAGARDKHGLPLDQWTAIKIIVMGWRAAHPMLVQCWWDLQDAAIDAVANPGKLVYLMDNKVAYMSQGGFLWCRLPSGRVLAYCRPKISYAMTAWIEYEDGRPAFQIEEYSDEHEAMWQYVAAYGGGTDYAITNSLYFLFGVPPTMQGGGKLVVKSRRRVDYEGYTQEKKVWGRHSLYGGMQFNHVGQGTARDVLADGMLRLEAAGYPVVFHCHDEVVSEVDSGFGSVADFVTLLTTNPDYLTGCPLAAKGWTGQRYGK
jgi:DNA polymerase